MGWKIRALAFVSIALLSFFLWAVLTQDFVRPDHLIFMGIEYDETHQVWVEHGGTIRSWWFTHVYLDEKIDVQDIGKGCRLVKPWIRRSGNQAMIDAMSCESTELFLD
jgi:hypothetical protein